MTKRQEMALKTRQKILDAVYELLQKNEFDELNIDDITNHCAVAKGTFYTYFKHKDDVVFEICRNLFADIQKRINSMKNKNIIDKLSYYFDEFIKEVERYGINMTRVWIKGVIDPNKAPINYDNKKWQYDCEMLKNILDNAVKNNELKKDTPTDLLTNLIITQLYGMMTIWCMSDGIYEPKSWTKKFSKIQLRAILNDFIER